jgi:hypothetical protein
MYVGKILSATSAEHYTRQFLYINYRKLLKKKYNRIRREGYSLARLKLKNITKKKHYI